MNNIQIGVLSSTYTIGTGVKSEVHPIYYNENYGVTSPTLITSNGDIVIVARKLENDLRVDRFRQEVPNYSANLIVDNCFVNKGEVEIALRRAIDKLKVSQ